MQVYSRSRQSNSLRCQPLCRKQRWPLGQIYPVMLRRVADSCICTLIHILARRWLWVTTRSVSDCTVRYGLSCAVILGLILFKSKFVFAGRIWPPCQPAKPGCRLSVSTVCANGNAVRSDYRKTRCTFRCNDHGRTTGRSERWAAFSTASWRW